MKKQLLLISLLSLSFTTLVACSEDEIREGAIASMGANRFYITVEDVIENFDAVVATDSRLSIDNLKVSFEDGDKIGVTSGEIVNLEYNLKVNSDGSVIATAVDEVQSAHMAIGDSVYAYYPYKEDATEVVKFQFPAEQVQSDEGASQLATYDVLVATPGVLSSNNSLSFGHAVTWVEFDVYNDYSTSVDYLQSVTLTAPNAVFVTEAELITTADANSSDYKSLKPTATTNEITVSVEEGVEDWNAMEAGGMTTLRMAIVPVDLSDMELTVTIETKEKSGDDKIIYTGEGMDFSAGREYRLILGEDEEDVEPEPVGDLEFYIPLDWRSNDFENDNSTWSYNRSMESTHFIIFWEKSFGSDPTNAPRNGGVDMSFSPSAILEYAEEVYDVNVSTLGFKDMQGSSYLNQYKMIIVVYYAIGEDFLATGSGYDDVIGTLWANVDGCTEETMAHEIGHCFQYQTWCDAQLAGSNNSSSCGWRYGFGKNPGDNGADDGNGWWEQCAQWQCFQVYPSGMFSSYYGDFPPNVHLHPLHETPRYSNYFIQDYWIMLHGDDFLGTVWRMAEKPEDPIDVYMRLTSVSQSEFNEEMFDYACRLQTYDITHCANNGGTSNIDAFSKYPGILDNGDGYYRINRATAPENFGFNAIRIKAPGSATTMSADLVGMAGETGYRSPSDTTGTLWSLDKAGWKFGFVGYNSRSNTRYYGEHYSMTGASATGTATFACPADCDYVWLVVMGAPTSYWHHAWNNTSTDDEQWPYKFKLTNAELYNSVQQETWDSSSKTYTVSLSFQPSSGQDDYVATTISPDLDEIASGLGLSSSSEFSSNLSRMTVVGLNADGTTTSGATAKGTYGYWFNASGKVCSWGDDAYVYVETDDFSSITFGQFPNHCVSGTTYHAGYQITYRNNTVKIIVKGTAE